MLAGNVITVGQALTALVAMAVFAARTPKP
jgi:hypothetical protein